MVALEVGSAGRMPVPQRARRPRYDEPFCEARVKKPLLTSRYLCIFPMAI
jgi:hypothetical protein